MRCIASWRVEKRKVKKERKKEKERKKGKKERQKKRNWRKREQQIRTVIKDEKVDNTKLVYFVWEKIKKCKLNIKGGFVALVDNGWRIKTKQ